LTSIGDGPRGTRYKKRQEHRLSIKRANHVRRREEQRQAIIKHQKKQLRIHAEIKAIREQAKHLLEVKALKLQVQQQKAQLLANKKQA